MLTIVLLILAVLVGGFFAIRYISLVHALRHTRDELALIRRDLSQNQMLHLPLPNPELAALLNDLNGLLSDIQHERQNYAKRERAFQQQIEAISHDLRTPLTVILGYLKLFRQNQHAQLAADPELAETVAVLEQKAETMSTLVGQFYDYSRLAADDMPLTLERIDAGRILREALAGNYQLLADAQLHIDADLPEHPLWILGDTAALSRIFQNLLQNAGRYAESRLSLYAEENGNQLILQFTNDTSRLSAEDVDHLFDRFYTSDASRHQGSTGLGLTVAQALAEDMQGQLAANTHVINDQQFLTFTLTLKKI